MKFNRVVLFGDGMKNKISNLLLLIKNKLEASITLPSISMTGTASVATMPKDLYEDAVCFMEQANTNIDPTIKRRYRKAALIFFCASTEAWINSTLRAAITNKTRRSKTEMQLLAFLNNISDIPTDDYRSIRKRLYNSLGEALRNRTIKFGTVSEFDRYIDLSEARNAVAHYVAARNLSVVYDLGSPNGLEKSVNNAPMIISNLYKKVHALDSSIEIPTWITP